MVRLIANFFHLQIVLKQETAKIEYNITPSRTDVCVYIKIGHQKRIIRKFVMLSLARHLSKTMYVANRHSTKTYFFLSYPPPRSVEIKFRGASDRRNNVELGVVIATDVGAPRFFGRGPNENKSVAFRFQRLNVRKKSTKNLDERSSTFFFLFSLFISQFNVIQSIYQFVDALCFNQL